MAIQSDEQLTPHALEAEIIEAGGYVFGRQRIRCPWSGSHRNGDRTPSGSIYQSSDGVWRFKCHGCGYAGDVYDIRARRNGQDLAGILPHREQSRLAPPAAAPRQYPSLDALTQSVPGQLTVYRYGPSMAVIRQEVQGRPKKFLQASERDGVWVMSAAPKPWPLYRLDSITHPDADPIIVTEGEKAADALAAIGFEATTSAGGAGQAHGTDWTPLAGRSVVIWPDNDEPGMKYAAAVTKLLDGLCPPARTAQIAIDGLGLPEKGDAADLCARDGANARETILRALDAAIPSGASRESGSVIADMADGRRVAIPWPWGALSRLSSALLPGTVTVLCGDPGATKSLMMLEAVSEWHAAGVPCVIYELEEDRAYHMIRLLAQRSGNSGITQPDWCRAFPEQSKGIHEAHRDWLDDIGRVIHEAPDKQVSLDEMLMWIERMAAGGNRVIVVDPITAAEGKGKPWEDDRRFLIAAKTIMREHGTSLVLVTHPRKGSRGGGGQFGLDDLSGGAAYQRFSQTVLWVERIEPPVCMEVFGPVGSGRWERHEASGVNRTVWIKKARNGRGHGSQIAFRFDGSTLRSSELGIVVSKSGYVPHIGLEVPQR